MDEGNIVVQNKNEELLEWEGSFAEIGSIRIMYAPQHTYRAF